MTSASKPLVSIGRKPFPPTRPTALPVIHIFFGIGAVVGFLATTWWGVHLWMALEGAMPVRSTFAAHREAHAFAQIYLFIGLFVSGFLIQTMTKLMRVESRPAGSLALVLPLHLIALLGATTSPSPLAFRVPIAIAYLLLLIRLIRLQPEALAYHRLRVGVPIGLGLGVFGGAALLDMGVPINAAVVLIAGLLPIVFATVQQFIVGFLDGHLPTPSYVRALVGAIVALVMTLLLMLLSPNSTVLPRIAAIAMFGCALLVAAGTSPRILAHRSDPVALAAAMAFGWLGAAAGVLFFGGSASADSVVHLIGTGIAIPLIIATSARILGFLSRNEMMNDRALAVAIIVWQLVPFGRARILDLPAWFSWVVGIAAFLTLALWLGLVLRRISVVVRRRFFPTPISHLASSTM